MVGLNKKILLDGNDLFVEFKGALTEQYVLQQLITNPDLNIYYYTNDNGSCEVDFLVDTGDTIVPVEVKAEVNLRAKSLRMYVEKFAPDVAIRTSMQDYKKESWLVNLPLYAIENLTKEVLKWLKDLATENLHWTYEDITEFNPEKRYERDYLPDSCNDFAIEFSTGYMYSDFGSSQHFMALNDCLCEDSFHVGYRSYLTIPYSGNSQCMVCGDIEPEFEDDGCLACRGCEDYNTCDHCGGRVGETYYIDGMNLCDTCYDEHVCQCSACERDCYEGNMTTIYITPRITAEMMEKLRTDYKDCYFYASNLAFIDHKDTQFIYRKNYPQAWLCDDDRCFENWIEKYLKPEERPHRRLNQWSEHSDYVYFDQLNEAGREEFAWEWHDVESFMNSMRNQNIIPTTPPELI
jgi:hypothetical protein